MLIFKKPWHDNTRWYDILTKANWYTAEINIFLHHHANYNSFTSLLNLCMWQMILSKLTWFCQYMCFLVIKPMTLALLVSCPTSWATGTTFCRLHTAQVTGVFCTSNCAAVTLHAWLFTLTFKTAVNSQFSGWKQQSVLWRSIHCIFLRMLVSLHFGKGFTE